MIRDIKLSVNMTVLIVAFFALIGALLIQPVEFSGKVVVNGDVHYNSDKYIEPIGMESLQINGMVLDKKINSSAHQYIPANFGVSVNGVNIEGSYKAPVYAVALLWFDILNTQSPNPQPVGNLVASLPDSTKYKPSPYLFAMGIVVVLFAIGIFYYNRGK